MKRHGLSGQLMHFLNMRQQLDLLSRRKSLFHA